MMKPKAVLFDLDGTLLDTAHDLGGALNSLLADEGRDPVGADVYRSLASHGSRGLLTHAYGDELSDRFDELKERFLTLYRARIAEQTCFFAGVDELIESLHQQQIACAVVTNKPAFLTHELLPAFPLLHQLDVVVCGDTLSVAKPNPAPLLHAAEKLGIAATDCWYIGDAERDIQAGKNANMFSVVARYGYIGSHDAPHLWGADAEIHAPLELLDLIRQSKS